MLFVVSLVHAVSENASLSIAVRNASSFRRAMRRERVHSFISRLLGGSLDAVTPRHALLMRECAQPVPVCLAVTVLMPEMAPGRR
jgi:hypothetical protein